MVTNIVMPRLGWTMVEGTVVKWLKEKGEKVEKGEILCEIETEKITSVVEAPTSGTLHKIVTPEGSTVPVGELIAIITETGEEIPAGLKAPPKKIKEKIVEKRVLISPSARKLAQEHKVDITKIQETGPGGRIVRDDVLKVIELEKKPAVPLGKVIPLKGMRKIIAERMSQSVQTAAHVTQVMEVDATELVRFRERLLLEIEKMGKVRLSFTDIIVKAVAKALEVHPMVNSLLIDEEIHLIDDINIGVAVALEEGLIVPVVHSANKKTLTEIAVVLNELVEKARRGKLSVDDVTGGTFTITNIGVFGVSINTPLVNLPQTAILGVGTITKKPAVINDKIEIRSMLNLNLSYDHRAHDGAQIARFLQTVKQFLENPDLLLT